MRTHCTFNGCLIRTPRFNFRREHLAQGLDSVKQSRNFRRTDLNGVARNTHHITLGAERRKGLEREDNCTTMPGRSGGCADGNLVSQRLGEQPGEIFCYPANTAAVGVQIDLSPWAELKRAGANLHLGGLGNNGEFRGGFPMTKSRNAETYKTARGSKQMLDEAGIVHESFLL